MSLCQVKQSYPCISQGMEEISACLYGEFKMYELEEITVVSPALRQIKFWIFQMYDNFRWLQEGNMKKNLTSGICKQCKPDKAQNYLQEKGGIQIVMFASFSIIVLWNPQISTYFPL